MSWAEELKQLLPINMDGHGSYQEMFLTRCCGKEDVNPPNQPSMQMPNVLRHIFAAVMPICGVLDEKKWPTAVTLEFFSNGYVMSSHNVSNFTSGWRIDLVNNTTHPFTFEAVI